MCNRWFTVNRRGLIWNLGRLDCVTFKKRGGKEGREEGRKGGREAGRKGGREEGRDV